MHSNIHFIFFTRARDTEQGSGGRWSLAIELPSHSDNQNLINGDERVSLLLRWHSLSHHQPSTVFLDHSTATAIDPPLSQFIPHRDIRRSKGFILLQEARIHPPFIQFIAKSNQLKLLLNSLPLTSFSLFLLRSRSEIEFRVSLDQSVRCFLELALLDLLNCSLFFMLIVAE